MDLHRYPGLLDRLAGEYALGVLRGGARRRFEQLAGREPAVQAAIDAWRARLGALPELAPAVAPPAHVWNSLERRLGIDRRADAAGEPQASPSAASAAPRFPRAPTQGRTPNNLRSPRWFDSLGFWRGWSIGATGAALAAVVALAVSVRPWALLTFPVVPPGPVIATQAGAPVIERVSYVAALDDMRTNKTMVFVMWDEQSAMMSAHRMGAGHAMPEGKSEQLWGIPEHGRPVSLGMLPPGEVVHMKVRGVNAFVKLAVSVEPPGGSSDVNGPSGPVVCAGKLMATA